jgi:hypothetical protein
MKRSLSRPTAIVKPSRKWFAEVERVLGHDSYVSHVDEVLGSGYLPDEAVQQSLALYDQLINVVMPRSNDWVATLVIPLHFGNGERWATKIDLRVPPFTKWQSEWANEEPPSIGIYRRALLLRADNMEEYRCPITEAVLSADRGQIDCYYRTWCPDSRNEGEREYSRAVYLEYQGGARVSAD